MNIKISIQIYLHYKTMIPCCLSSRPLGHFRGRHQNLLMGLPLEAVLGELGPAGFDL